MRVLILVVNLALLPFVCSAASPPDFETDTLTTSLGDLKITFLGHGTLVFQFAGKVIHVDPVGRYADYSRLPKADLILVTHEHGDHLDKQAIGQITKAETQLVLTAACAEKVGQGVVMKNGDVKTFRGLQVEAVPAYNVVHMRSPGRPFHPKGSGNGYVIAFGDKRVYVAGDTENVPEMAQLTKIDVAFLPMNLPYTMTPEMVADAVRTIKPRIVYPYHFGNTDTSELVRLLKDMEGVEIRVRKMQ
jgi:L-ascorbate metabolism protein UlaG (beta-lactamase superfamily)